MAEPLTPLLTRRCSIGATEETVAGTFVASAVPLAATEVFDIKCESEDFFADTKRTAQGLYGGESDATAGKQAGKVSFTVRVRSLDKTLPLLTGCGWKATAGTYSPQSSLANKKTWSFNVWEDGRTKKLAGVCLNCKFSAKTGSYLLAKFEGTGIWLPPIIATMPTQAALNAAGYVALASTLTFGGTGLPMVDSFDVDLGAKPELREWMAGNAQGIASALVGNDYEPKISLDPESRLVADNDAYGQLLSGATGALVIALTSGAHVFTITAPRAQYRKITDGSRGTRRLDSIELSPNVSVGDDFLTLEET